MGQDLSDREIRTRFDTMEATNAVSHTSMNVKLDKIIVHTSEHNHRMTKMEQWRSYLIGAWAVVTLFVVPLVLYINAVESNFLGEQINQLKGDIEGIIAQL